MITPAREFFTSLLDLVYPPVCSACNTSIIPADQFICAKCRQSLEPIPPPFCAICGYPLPDLDHTENPKSCPKCLKPSYFTQARSLLSYHEIPVKNLIHALKFHYQTRLAQPLGELLCQAYERHYPDLKFDGIIPVPLHKSRLREREFNQSLLISQQLARQYRIPILDHAVTRIRRTPPQTRLSPDERLRNTAGAFSCNDPDAISGKTLLVTDDVMTTGCTVNELCKILKQSRAARVYVLTLARAID